MNRALAVVVFGAAASGAAAHEGPAPNRVDISPALMTSGQPTKAFLETLKAQGFEAAVYLAPPTVGDALAEEPKIVGGQGLLYVNIPIVWEKPTAADFQSFTRVMQALADRKVFVHCQMNFRASSLVFLHRVITLKDLARVRPRFLFQVLRSTFAAFSASAALSNAT